MTDKEYWDLPENGKTETIGAHSIPMVSESELATIIGHDPKVSVCADSWGYCECCGKWNDLRWKVCFTCSDFVDGHEIQGGHELWDTRNPKNRWRIVSS